MKKIIIWSAIIFGVMMAISIILTTVSLIFSGKQTSKDILENGIRNFNEGDYEMATSYFSDLKPEDSLYKKAQIYIFKIDSISEVKKINDSISVRNEKIKSQFSAWDGAHRNLEKAIKNSLNDPKSYEHVQTTYKDLNDKIFITTIYRGKNVFGGVVTKSISAYSDLDGNIIEFLN